MIEFFGVLSYETKLEVAKLKSKISGNIFLVVTILTPIITSLATIFNGNFKKVWYLILILTIIFVFITVLMYYVPTKRVDSFKIKTKVQIENGNILQIVEELNTFLVKPISKVKKVIDYGCFYAIIFNMGDITNAFICEKQLLIKGTLKDFEELFKDKLESKKQSSKI